MQPPNSPRLPTGVVVAVSAGVIVHLSIVVFHSLAAPSGPWPDPTGSPQVMPGPRFARVVDQAGQEYLKPLHLTNNYHFLSNRIAERAQYTVQFEAILRDKRGKVFKTVKFPDREANFWVRHRQEIVARALLAEEPIERTGAPGLAPKGSSAGLRVFWVPEGGDEERARNRYTLRIGRENQMPLQGSMPSKWALLVARSYVRYLKAAHDAASVELIRHSRTPVQNEMIADFWNGEPRPASDD